MKKTKLFFALLAIILAGTFLVAENTMGRTDPACIYSQQYYKLGFSYMPTGQMGLHYVCFINPYICTYYLPDPVLQPDDFHPCRTGVYYPVNG
jgi:hypothetical protein